MYICTRPRPLIRPAHCVLMFLSAKKRKAIAKQVPQYVGSELTGPGVEAAPFKYEFVDHPTSTTGVSVASHDVSTVVALQATTRMCSLFRQAMHSDPEQDGAAPWQAVIEAAAERNGGVAGAAGGSGFKIVTDSRSSYYHDAATAALMAISGSPDDMPLDDMCQLVRASANAGDLSPIDSGECVRRLRNTRAALALEKTAATDTPDDLCALYGEAAAWSPKLFETATAACPKYASLCMTHRSDVEKEITLQAKECETALKKLMSK